MKLRNKQFLQSWSTPMLKWALWSVFGVGCMGVMGWWEREPQIAPIVINGGYRDRFIFAATQPTTQPAYLWAGKHRYFVNHTSFNGTSGAASSNLNSVIESPVAMTTPIFADTYTVRPTAIGGVTSRCLKLIEQRELVMVKC